MQQGAPGPPHAPHEPLAHTEPAIPAQADPGATHVPQAAPACRTQHPPLPHVLLLQQGWPGAPHWAQIPPTFTLQTVLAPAQVAMPAPAGQQAPPG
jgi:hypothetical protein